MHDIDSLFAGLRRRPDVEAPNLFASDAADRLMLDEAATAMADAPAGSVVVIGDQYGALTLGAAKGLDINGIRVGQDALTSQLALAENAASLAGSVAFTNHEIGRPLVEDAHVVLLRLPRSLSELAEISETIARYANPNVVVFAGGRDKHMTRGMNDVLARSFGSVRAGRGRQKSRVITASEPKTDVAPTFPVTEHYSDLDIDVVAHGAVFAGSKIDIGTRYLLGFIGRMKADAVNIVDLGCGSGILAVKLAQARDGATVTATDRSAAAISSTRATAAANGVDIRIVRDDAMSTFADSSVDLIVCNPPFHEGASVHTGGAFKLFEAAGRTLDVGGEMWTVYNSHLGHRAALIRTIGPTDIVGKNAKFTVARSMKAY